ncbi:MAG TPA: hypothetical protein PLZ05_01790 [Alphaproteobacteria bacterium]|nr:hypothetical protein [Alphaproteobacteria bacterium]
MKKTLLFVNGLSGSGKDYFIENYLPKNLFHNLIVAANRQPRDGEIDGVHKYFRSDEYFDKKDNFATWSWVNEFIWEPGKQKWFYGIPEFEVFNNIGKNLVYNVIEPRYSRQLIDWFIKQKLDKEYQFKIAYLLPPNNNFEIAQKRANMPDDDTVRRHNTCNPIDFLRAGLHPDWLIKSSKVETIIPEKFKVFVKKLEISK